MFNGKKTVNIDRSRREEKPRKIQNEAGTAKKPTLTAHLSKLCKLSISRAFGPRDSPATILTRGTSISDLFFVPGPWSRLGEVQHANNTMPTYELVVLFREMKTPALKSALKRTAGHLFEAGATLRKMTNLGFRDMPYFIKRKGVRHRFAHYFVFDFDSGVNVPKPLKEKLMLDLDVVRATSWLLAETPVDLHFPPPQPECTMHLDLLPPPYRANIIKLQEEAEKKATKKHTHKNYEDKQFLIF